MTLLQGTTLDANIFNFTLGGDDQAIIDLALALGFKEDDNVPWRYYMEIGGKQKVSFFLNVWGNVVSFSNHLQKVDGKPVNAMDIAKPDFLKGLQVNVEAEAIRKADAKLG